MTIAESPVAAGCCVAVIDVVLDAFATGVSVVEHAALARIATTRNGDSERTGKSCVNAVVHVGHTFNRMVRNRPLQRRGPGAGAHIGRSGDEPCPLRLPGYHPNG